MAIAAEGTTVTFDGTVIAGVKTIDGPNEKQTAVETTCLADTVATTRPGIVTPGTYSLEVEYDGSQDYLIADHDNHTFVETLTDGTTLTVTGYLVDHDWSGKESEGNVMLSVEYQQVGRYTITAPV